MRIAIISDIHGNLEALKTVLKDIENRNIDKIFCLGDIVAKGAHSEECLKLIKEKCEVVLRGNCDNIFDTKAELDYEKKFGLTVKIQQDRIDYLKKCLTEESKQYLRNLPFSYEFYMSGSLIRLFHANPEIVDKVILCEDPYEKQFEQFLPSDNTLSDKIADVVIYGHLHAQFMTKLYNRTLINTGSIGNSFNVIRDNEKDADCMETTVANYLILSGKYDDRNYNSDLSFEFIKVNYDIDKELINSTNAIEKEELVKELKYGIYRNMKKISGNCN